VGAHTNEILTEIEGWPEITVRLGDVDYQRPAILVKE
jgi:hypothetical protein